MGRKAEGGFDHPSYERSFELRVEYIDTDFCAILGCSIVDKMPSSTKVR